MAESSQAADHDESRRDFLVLAAGAMGAVGAASFAWPLIDQMNPAADVLALASTEVDLSKIQMGQSITVKWRGKPVFVRRRSVEEIKTAGAVALDQMIDPQADADRTQKPEWLILLGVCTHLGRVNTAGGSAPATARITIRRGAFVRARHRSISRFRLISSSTTPRSRSVKGVPQ